MAEFKLAATPRRWTVGLRLALRTRRALSPLRFEQRRWRFAEAMVAERLLGWRTTLLELGSSCGIDSESLKKPENTKQLPVTGVTSWGHLKAEFTEARLRTWFEVFGPALALRCRTV